MRTSSAIEEGDWLLPIIAEEEMYPGTMRYFKEHDIHLDIREDGNVKHPAFLCVISIAACVSQACCR